MKRSKEKPPIYERCRKKFGISWNRCVIFAYGDTIHCKYKVPKYKIAHEKTHLKQQSIIGPEVWWDRYIEDVAFRLEMETEAYKNEIDFIRTNVRNIKKREEMIDQTAIDLSSSMYGNIVTLEEAEKLLGLDNRF